MRSSSSGTWSRTEAERDELKDLVAKGSKLARKVKKGAGAAGGR